MLTKEQMIEALLFLEKALEIYPSNKNRATSLVGNYMLGRDELNKFLMERDLVYCSFMKHGWIEADFISALRTLRNEIQNS